MEFNHNKVDIYEAMGVREVLKETLTKLNYIIDQVNQEYTEGPKTSRFVERLSKEVKEDEALLRILLMEAVISNSEEG